MVSRTIVHYEIPTSNREETEEFYSALFGWEFNTDENFGYTMIRDGGSGGGLAPVGENMKPGDVLIYIGSDDIDADLKKVESLGGKISVTRMDIPGFGALGVFIDPTGNRIALWQSIQS